jgi:hypothetical protein
MCSVSVAKRLNLKHCELEALAGKLCCPWLSRSFPSEHRFRCDVSAILCWPPFVSNPNNEQKRQKRSGVMAVEF